MHPGDLVCINLEFPYREYWEGGTGSCPYVPDTWLEMIGIVVSRVRRDDSWWLTFSAEAGQIWLNKLDVNDYNDCITVLSNRELGMISGPEKCFMVLQDDSHILSYSV